MRIATWNVNSLKARLPRVLDWLAANDPDVIALQELKLEEDQCPIGELADAGYTGVFHGQRQWNGVAILARSGVTDAARPLADHPGGARAVYGRVGELGVMSIYAPNGKYVAHPDYSMKLDWLTRLTDHIAQAISRGRPLVVAGDFNIVPADIDTWDAALNAGVIFHTEPERAGIARLESLGLTDLYRHANPETRAFTWWDYRAGNFHKGIGLRIDLVYGTADLRDRLRGARIDRDARKGKLPSDHAPVIIDLDD